MGDSCHIFGGFDSLVINLSSDSIVNVVDFGAAGL